MTKQKTSVLLLNEITAVFNGLLSGANIGFLHNTITCFYCVQKGVTVRSLSRHSKEVFLGDTG